MAMVDALAGFFDGDTIQVVGFGLGSEEFAVPILAVREINQLPEITAIPHAPSHVLGITNLRGRVIPVIDTAAHFGLSGYERDEKSARMIVVEVGDRPVGFLVDAVSQVRRISKEQCDAAPAASTAARAEFIAGIAKLEPHLVILLDPARMIGLEDLPPEQIISTDQPMAVAA